jgi:urate oxidase
LNLTEINQLSPQAFLEHFARVLEHSPRYAERAALKRPFSGFEDLHRAFSDAIHAQTPAAQLELIRAHPDLAGKAAIAGELTNESASEQASAGLDRLTPEEFAEFTRVNTAYRAKFEMPYIVCVREHTKASILAGAAERLGHDLPTERAKALEEIGKIARLRLRDLVKDGMRVTPKPVTQKSRIVLGQNNYGKADVRLFKVFRNQARHEVKDVWVDVAMTGDFTAAHTLGDNTDLLATDTVRNTVYALAKDGLTGSIEEFGKHLIRHFVQAGPRVSSVRVTMTEHRWDRIPVTNPAGDNLEHDHSFTRDVGKHTAVVEGDGSQFTVTSGIDELFILKTTNSGWEGFLREQYTTLPDTNDRILATVVTAHWHYNHDDVNYDQVWAGVWQQILTTFTDHYSPSMQGTLYEMGKAVLERFPEIEKIHFSFPNKHHIKYNLERFGMENPNTIFHADAEPYGLIEGWVERAE